MTVLERHEMFEIEVLDRLKSARILDRLVFGGGTMLRLCHDMPRFSADLDFWKLRETADEKLLTRIQNTLSRYYEITDAEMKFYSLLVEVRSASFPRRLKIEIRREVQEWEYEEKIAYSKFSTRQVLVKAHTLRQTLKNKIAALLDRCEIRDAFDMEFILRQGVDLPPLSESERKALIQKLQKFKSRDFKVTLGSVLEKELRDYYNTNGFHFLLSKLQFSS